MTPRRTVLIALLASVVLLTAVVLFEVLGTVFFAVTVGYVLSPLRSSLVDRGLSKRIAAILVTTTGFVGVIVLLSPVAFVLNRRQGALLELLRTLPDEFPVASFGAEFVLETQPLVDATREALRGFAVDVAAAAPVLGLKLFLFAFLVYALLLSPGAARRAIFGAVPPEYHDLTLALDRRIRRTLFAIYVVQAATAVATFAIAYGLFGVLGYDSALSLAVVAGVLQFVPILGPSLLIGLLGALDVFLLAEPIRGLTVIAVGLVLVALLPDALIRPQIAGRTADIPASLYFVGFVGGVLTIGPVGIIAGPVIVGLFVEVISLLSAENSTTEAVA